MVLITITKVLARHRRHAVSKFIVPRWEQLILILLMSAALASCGSQEDVPVEALSFEIPSFDVSAAVGRFGGKNPVGLFWVSNRTLRARKKTHLSCTSFLVQNGYILSNRHCLIDLWGSGRAWPLEDIRIFFKNPGDQEARPVRIRRIVAERFMVPSVTYQSKKTPEDNERLAESFEDWAVLEPYQREEISARYGLLKLERTSPDSLAPADRLAVEILRVNPPTADDQRYVLEFVPGLVKRRHIYAGTEDFRQVLKFIKVVSVEETLIRQGNSGSPVLVAGKALGMIGLAANKEDWRWPTRLNEDVNAGLVQWFPGADASIDAVNRP